MFVQSLLAENRHDVLWDLMRQNPLGALVVSAEGSMDANHLPFEFDQARGLARTHVSRSNPLWATDAQASKALVIFQGPNHYISPGWQPGRAKHGRVAPSWNYAVAHVYGALTFVEDTAWLMRHLAALASRHEDGRPSPWSLDEPPAGFIPTLAERIVGVEIAVDRLIGKSQACQQYNVATREGVIAGLEGEGSSMAVSMAAVVRGAASP